MKNQEKHNRTELEILKELEIQEKFIQLNMNEIARKERDFHKQLAINLRTIFHNTTTSKSIFSQLGWTDKIQMVTTCSKFNPQNIHAFIGLAHFRVESTIGQYGPKGFPSDKPKQIPFKYWWEEEIILRDSNGEIWRRKDLVTFVANKDGGGHIDPKLPGNYHGLAYKNSMGFKFFNGAAKEKSDLENPIPACLWQIGLEYKMSVDLFRKGKIEISFE